jgi:hypothetical protein
MNITDQSAMVVIFTLLANAGLVAAMIGKILLLYAIIAQLNASGTERVMRSIAATAGCLLYIASKAIGISIPAFLLQALTQGGALLTGILGALLPAAVGFIVTWYVTGYLNSRNARRNRVGMRLLALVMSLTVLLFGDVYIASVSVSAAHDPNTLRLLMPNVSFCLATMLFAIFRFHPETDEAAAGPTIAPTTLADADTTAEPTA